MERIIVVRQEREGRSPWIGIVEVNEHGASLAGAWSSVEAAAAERGVDPSDLPEAVVRGGDTPDAVLAELAIADWQGGERAYIRENPTSTQDLADYARRGW